MIYLTVGTYPKGFDRLVEAVDLLCAEYKVECIAQISGGSYKPHHMTYQSFYSSDVQANYIGESQFVIAHGGFGIIGDVMRHGKALLVFPRPPEEGPNDQRPVAEKLAEQYGFSLSTNLDELRAMFSSMLKDTVSESDYRLETNVPSLVSEFLKTCSKAKNFKISSGKISLFKNYPLIKFNFKKYHN